MRADNRKPWRAVDDRGGEGVVGTIRGGASQQGWGVADVDVLGSERRGRRPLAAVGGTQFAALGPTVRAFVSAIGHSCQAQ